MDLKEIAREQRRRQAQDALDFEREREAALRSALEVTAADLEGAGVDEAAFAEMPADQVEIVRGTLTELEDFDHLSEGVGEEWFSLQSEDEIRAERGAEVERLQAELADSRRRQAAFERYLELLSGHA